MRVIQSPSGTVRVLETDADVSSFRVWMTSGNSLFALDTETSGLDVYAPGHSLRLVQFADANIAYVVDAARWANDIRWALARPVSWVCHNAPYDLQVLARHGLVAIEDIGLHTFDTHTYGHHLDPRHRAEGGHGLSLDQLSAEYLGEHKAKNELAAEMKAGKWNWTTIPLDNEVYLRYAGLDALLTYRLFRVLEGEVARRRRPELVAFDHRVQHVLNKIMFRGVLVDVEYTTELSRDLDLEARAWAAEAEKLGLANVNSTRQIAKLLLEQGEILTAVTKSGQLQVDANVLMELADLDRQWKRLELRTPNAVAEAVLRSKRAEKWRSAYTEAFLSLRDENDRLHPSIRGLAARTARMSISSPPLQQLPTGDSTVRSCLVADDGCTMLAADYSGIELRVLAALSGDETMLAAIANGEDLHDFTAERVYGSGFSPRQRKIAKGVSFGKVYGGGVETVSRQTGAAPEAVKHAMAEYDRLFPGVKRFSRRLEQRAQYGRREVETASGRILPLDRDRLYSAVNYACQSAARDIFAEALLRLDDAGLTQYLLVPVHDELLFQAPNDRVEEIRVRVASGMDANFYGVSVCVESSVYGRSWGDGYRTDAERANGLARSRGLGVSAGA